MTYEITESKVAELAAHDQVLRLALNAVTKRLNDLVVDCMDDSGKLRTPSKKVLMQARAALPKQHTGSF